MLTFQKAKELPRLWQRNEKRNPLPKMCEKKGHQAQHQAKSRNAVRKELSKEMVQNKAGSCGRRAATQSPEFLPGRKALGIGLGLHSGERVGQERSHSSSHWNSLMLPVCIHMSLHASMWACVHSCSHSTSNWMLVSGSEEISDFWKVSTFCLSYLSWYWQDCRDEELWDEYTWK